MLNEGILLHYIFTGWICKVKNGCKKDESDLSVASYLPVGTEGKAGKKHSWSMFGFTGKIQFFVVLGLSFFTTIFPETPCHPTNRILHFQDFGSSLPHRALPA